VFYFIYKGYYYNKPTKSLSKEGKASIFRILESTLITLLGDNLKLLKYPRVFALIDIFRIDNLKALTIRNLKA